MSRGCVSVDIVYVSVTCQNDLYLYYLCHGELISVINGVTVLYIKFCTNKWIEPLVAN